MALVAVADEELLSAEVSKMEKGRKDGGYVRSA